MHLPTPSVSATGLISEAHVLTVQIVLIEGSPS
jgi:hypothetical protein